MEGTLEGSKGWKGTSYDKLEDSEERMAALAGLQLSELNHKTGIGPTYVSEFQEEENKYNL